MRSSSDAAEREGSSFSGPDDAIQLSHGGPIPRLGLGVFQIPDGEPVQRAVEWALEAGYRHIDTASIYGNESGVGAAVREGRVPREELFVATKLWNADHGYDAALRAFEVSLEVLGLDWIDLYLVHWPVGGQLEETWRAMERIAEEGGARAIGVSNYLPHHLEELLVHANIPPAVNQIELHPFNFRSRLPILERCWDHGIVVEAYSPLTQGLHLDEPVLVEVARRVGCTSAQVLIRWALQKGAVVLPKSGKQERIRENGDVFGFRLEESEMDALDALDRNLILLGQPQQSR